MGCRLQEQSQPLPRQPAEAAHPRRWGRLDPVPDQELQEPVSLQVQLRPVELVRGLNAGSDEARAAAAGPHRRRGQAGREGQAQGTFGVEPVQSALRAVQGDLLHTALLLRQTTVRETGEETNLIKK